MFLLVISISRILLPHFFLPAHSSLILFSRSAHVAWRASLRRGGGPNEKEQKYLNTKETRRQKEKKMQGQSMADTRTRATTTTTVFYSLVGLGPLARLPLSNFTSFPRVFFFSFPPSPLLFPSVSLPAWCPSVKTRRTLPTPATPDRSMDSMALSDPIDTAARCSAVFARR